MLFMEKRVFLGYLYDFYGELLNDHQKEIYSEYILDDLSLNEIAEEHGVSRQSVFDLVKRCTKALEEYEEKAFTRRAFPEGEKRDR